MHISALDELFCGIMVRRLADLITTVYFHTASDALNDIVARKSAIKRQLWAKALHRTVLISIYDKLPRKTMG